MKPKTSDQLLRGYAQSRDMRDALKKARNACMCDRSEGVDMVDGIPTPQVGQPCWKAARQWDNGSSYDDDGAPKRFWFDPPISEWCESCRNRQAYTVQLRAAVRDHAAAKRSILQRGRAMVRREAV